MHNNYLEQLKRLFDHLDEVLPEKMRATFIHGSFASRTETPAIYQEQMFYTDNNSFWFSILHLQDIPPDVDMITVTDYPEEVLTAVQKNAELYLDKSHFLTLNIISSNEYERIVASDDAMAPKRLLVKRELNILKGDDYISKLKSAAIESYNDLDEEIQVEFDAKKSHMKELISKGIIRHVLTKEYYAEHYPNLLAEMEGVRIGGFNVNRVKFVYPQPMNLKCRVDIKDYSIKYLE